MAGCFGSHPVDRWLESQVNEYCEGPEYRRQRRLTHDERRAMEKYDLTEDEIREGIVPAFMGGE